LLSHVHGDHLGDLIQPSANAGTCAKPDFSMKVAPNSNTVNIAVGKKSKLIVGGEMAKFFARRIKEAGGEPPQVQLVRFGATTKIGGVGIASVPAVHSNGLDPAFLHKDHGEALEANGLTAYVGPPGGFVLTFSNGLVVYLSGDTGITAEQGSGGAPVLQGLADGAEHRRYLHHRADRGRLRDQRTGQVEGGDRFACQRVVHRGRRAAGRDRGCAAPAHSSRGGCRRNARHSAMS